MINVWAHTVQNASVSSDKQIVVNLCPAYRMFHPESSAGRILNSLCILFCVLFLVGCGSGTQSAVDTGVENSTQTASTDDSDIVQQGIDVSSAISGEISAGEPEIGAAQAVSNGSVVESGSSITIENITVGSIAAQSARINWQLSEPGTGQVLYGPTESVGLSSVLEERTEFSQHTQIISGLQADTVYYFQVVSTAQSGDTVSSNLQSFQTLTATIEDLETEVPVDVNLGVSQSNETSSITPVAAAGWPANYDNNVPLGNVFYGQYQVGFHTGNAAIALQSARRFRADRGGFINAVTYNNRTLSNLNIETRCKPSAPDSAWCKCVDAGLDKYTCGYTLSNSYSVGNGGSIVVEVRTDNNGLPSDTVLAETAIPFVPMANENVRSPVLELDKPAQLVAGEIYHLVFVNKNPPTSCGYGNVPVTQAAACPKNQGGMGLNGSTLTKVVGVDGGLDPFRGSSAASFIRRGANHEWIQDTDKLSWYEIRYDDGVWVGDSYASYAATGAGKESVGGAKLARQIFTVEDGTKIVDGVWLHFGHTDQGTSNGSPITVKLKDSDQNVLSSATISASQECIDATASGVASNNRFDQHCRAWGYAELGEATALIEGNEYSLEVSADEKAGIVISTYFPLNYSSYTFESRGHWDNSAAEISNDSGATWANFDTSTTRPRSMGLLFTISGMPRALP